MNNDVRLPNLIWHSTIRLLFSYRGLIALLFSVFMMSILGYIYDKLPPAFFELLKLFTPNPDVQFQWLLFDNSMSKLITLFVAPIFIFDAVSGDRSDDRFGIMLSRPITRTQYLLTKLFSAFFAFGLILIPMLIIGYPFYMSIVQTLTPVSYFSTSFLIYLLAFFTMSVGLLVSVLTKRSIVSFIAMFGVMAILMLPNASKFTSDSMDTIAMATPHYYATYFTSHPFDGLTLIAFAFVIILFSMPTLIIAIWKFRKEDL